jgi:hypothetical protein
MAGNAIIPSSGVSISQFPCALAGVVASTANSTWILTASSMMVVVRISVVNGTAYASWIGAGYISDGYGNWPPSRPSCFQQGNCSCTDVNQAWSTRIGNMLVTDYNLVHSAFSVTGLNIGISSGPLVISVPPLGALLASGSPLWPDGARTNAYCSPGTLVYLSLLSATDGETLVGGIFQRFDNAPNISSSCGMNQVMWNNPDNVTAAVVLGISCVSTACAGNIAFMAGPTPIVDIPPGNTSSSASCPPWMTWQSSAFDTNDCRLAPGYYVTSDGTGALCPAGAFCPGGMTLGEATATTTGGIFPCPPGSPYGDILAGASSPASCGVVTDQSLLNSSTWALAIFKPAGNATLSLLPTSVALGSQPNFSNGSIALMTVPPETWLPALCGSAFLRSPAAAVGGITFIQVGFQLPNSSAGTTPSYPPVPPSEMAWALNASSAYPDLTITAGPFLPTPGEAPAPTTTVTGALGTMPAMVLPWAAPFGDVSVAVGVSPSPVDSAFHVTTFTASQRLGGIVSEHGPALLDCSVLSSSAAAAMPSTDSLFLVCGTPGNQSVVAVNLGNSTSAPYSSTVLWTTSLNSMQMGVAVVTGIDVSPDGQELAIVALHNSSGHVTALVATANGTLVSPFTAVSSPSTWLPVPSVLNGTSLVNLSPSGFNASPPSGSAMPTSLVQVPPPLPSSDCSTRPDGSALVLQLGSGIPVPVVCHSGMVLLAKLDGGSPLWSYASWLWTTSTLLNPGSLAFDTVEAKLAAFNSFPVSRLRLGMLSLPAANSTASAATVSWLNVTLGGTYPSLLSAILANATLAYNATPAQWMSLLGGAGGIAAACAAQGLNVASTAAAATSVRIGLLAASVASPACSGWYTVGFGLDSSGGTATTGSAQTSSSSRRFGFILGGS